MAQSSPQAASEQFGTNLHPANDAACATAPRQPDGIGAGTSKPSEAVGRGLLHKLTDDQREAAIFRAGIAMEKAYADYLRSGNFADVGRAHHHLWQMGKLIEGRSAEMVARLEQERGLDAPACANDARGA